MTGPAPDPYKILQVDPEAEDEVIAAAYRRLARKYHPDVAAGPEAAARMAALNAAWERIGEPPRRAAFDRERRVEAALGHRASERPDPGPSMSRGTGTAAPRPEATGSARATPAREPETVSRDWTSGRSTVGGGYDASMRTADGEGAAGRAPGNPSGSTLNFRALFGLVAGRDQPHGPRIHRVARPLTDRPPVPRGSTSSFEASAGDAPPSLTRPSDGACSAAADPLLRRPLPPRLRRSWPPPPRAARPTRAGTGRPPWSARRLRRSR